MKLKRYYSFCHMCTGRYTESLIFGVMWRRVEKWRIFCPTDVKYWFSVFFGNLLFARNTRQFKNKKIYAKSINILEHDLSDFYAHHASPDWTGKLPKKSWWAGSQNNFNTLQFIKISTNEWADFLSRTDRNLNSWWVEQSQSSADATAYKHFVQCAANP